MRVSFALAENQMFFNILNDLGRASESGTPGETAQLLEEVAAVELHTSSKALRKRCQRILAERREPVAALRA